MKKQIKEILSKTETITIRWNNMGKWQTSFEGNCLDLAELEGIKIINKKKDNQLLLKYCFGCCKLTQFSNLVWLERDILNIVAMKQQYVGDKCKIESRFGNKTINF